MEGQVAAAGRAHSGAALEVEVRKQREAALQREVARQRAALAEAGNKIRHACAWLGCGCGLGCGALT